MNIQSDLATLNSLCAKAAGDIRSCLHFMQVNDNQFQRIDNVHFRLFQFVAAQRSRTITKKMVETSTVLGVKDAQKNLFEVWTEIFQIPPSKKFVLFYSLQKKPIFLSFEFRTQLTLQLDDPLKRSGKVPLAR